MDRGERKPKRWRWEGLTGAVWLVPSESSSSVDSSSVSESSEDAGVAEREDKGQLVQLTTSGLLLWGRWALPSVGGGSLALSPPWPRSLDVHRVQVGLWLPACSSHLRFSPSRGSPSV